MLLKSGLLIELISDDKQKLIGVRTQTTPLSLPEMINKKNNNDCWNEGYGNENYEEDTLVSAIRRLLTVESG